VNFFKKANLFGTVFVKYPRSRDTFDKEQDNKRYKKVWTIRYIACFCDLFGLFSYLFADGIPVSIELLGFGSTEVGSSGDF